MRRLLPPLTVLVVLLPLGTTASAGNSAAPLGQSAPTNTSAPTISGNTIQAETLAASAGSWPGPNPTYSYQWNRCDSSGAACTAIAGATASTHVLVAGDVGVTLRVAVMATNKNGSAIATSAATDVVAAASPVAASTAATSTTTTATPTAATTSTTTATSTTTTSTTATSTTTTTSGNSTVFPYFAGDFDTGNVSQWDFLLNPNLSNPPHAIAYPVAQGAYGGELTVDANDTTADTPNASRVDLYLDQRPHIGGLDDDNWVKAYIMFPGGGKYRASNGSWNWVMQFHNGSADPRYRGMDVESAIGVAAGGPLSGCDGATSNSSPQQLILDIRGGNLDSDYANATRTSRYCPHEQLLYDHWYEIVVHDYFSPTEGWVQWWLDGKLIVDAQTPTLYSRNDGSTDRTFFEIDNYRWNMNGAVTWPSTIYFDGIKLGPTRASVGA
jgi:hypothetical protein